MAAMPLVEQIPHLENFGSVVPDGYRYYEKLATPGDDLSLPSAYLKWYNIYPADAEISAEQDAECRAFLAAELRSLKFDHELGFVLLHRAGSVLLLLLITWRNTNELWESVYVKDLTQPGGYVPITYATSHRATYCVWELGAIWHERQAWMRFLSSKRDVEAKLAYINDRFTGSV